MSSSRLPVERRALVGLLALLAGLALGAAARSAMADELQPFQASYIWLWNGAPVALSRLTFAHRQDDLWVYSSATEPRGIGHLYPMRPKFESTMRIDSQGVQPLHFSVTGSGQRHDANVTFNWDGGAGQAIGIYQGDPLKLDVTRGVQDDLSVQIAMMLQMLRGVTPELLREIDKHGIRDYVYHRVGAETLLTAIGKVDTIVYATQHPGSPRITRYWCAAAQGYIPVKVQQTLNNHVQWTMTLESLERE